MLKKTEINFMKGISPLVSFVLVIGFGVAAMTIVLTIVNPLLDRAKDSALVNEATQNMLLIDSTIKAVASESEGSKRTIQIKITEGALRANDSNEWVHMEFDPRTNYEIDGFTGDIKIISRTKFLEFFNSYADGGTATSGVWSISNGTWTIDSSRFRGIGGIAYHILGNISNFEFTGTIAQSVEPEGQIFVLPVNPRNLVLYLPFDGNRNLTHRTVFDYSGYGLNGSLLNSTSASCFSNNACPAWTDAGRFGNATEFDGIGDYITVPNSSTLNITGGITVAAWINPATSSAGIRTIVNKNTSTSGNTIQLMSNEGNPHFEIVNGTIRAATGSTTLQAGTWYHLVGVFDTTNVLIYVNGVEEARTSATGSILYADFNWAIGARLTNPIDRLFNGTIDEVMIFNTSLSEPEVKFLYESSREKVTAGSKETQHIAEDGNATIVLSSPGTSFFDNIKVKQGEPKIRFLVPYDRVDIKDDARFGPGDHSIVIANDGVNASNGNRPIIVIRE